MTYPLKAILAAGMAAWASGLLAQTDIRMDTPVPYVAPDVPTGTGPFKAVMLTDPSLATHTIYRPADLSQWGGRKTLPIIVWGNGACSNVGNKFRRHLQEIASHGFIAIAVGPIGTPKDEEEPARPAAGAGAPPPPPAAGPNRPAPQSRSSQLVDAINWAVAENSRRGSAYFGKLDIRHIAAMGQSCGGVQAIEASADPRVTTSMIFNSGLMAEPTSMAGGAVLSKDYLKNFHAPVAYISGDPSDIAFKNSEDDFERINHVPVFRAYEKGIGHNGTHRWLNGGDFAVVSVNWLKWQMKGDQKAAAMFTGEKCGLCTNERWVVRKKGIK